MEAARPTLKATLHDFEDAVARRLRQWRHEDLSERLQARDPRLWSVHRPPELMDRMGWLDLPLRSASDLEEITAFAEEVRAAGLDHVVVLGMGGSSLAAEMFAGVLPVAGRSTLEVLDSTHPAAVREAGERLDPERTVFVVSSKSGHTLETLALYRYFGAWLVTAGRDPGPQMMAITDPETELAEEAESVGFRRLWLVDPEIGGRYSALSEFGLVPAALGGIDVAAVLSSAKQARKLLDGSLEEHIELFRLGAILGELARAGADKLTLLTGRGMMAFPAWAEQLVAESLGKRGRGIVPVAAEPLASAKAYDPDRLFVALEIENEHNAALSEALNELESMHPVIRIRVPQATDLGFELFRWEVAVALAAAVLGVHPFNQPDVEAAKQLARDAMRADAAELESQDGLWLLDLEDELADDATTGRLDAWLHGAVRGGYIGIQAYLPRTEELDAAVRGLRAELGQLTRLATTFGYGPRFLHSTGQLHKGGPNRGLFIQLVDDAGPEVSVPDADYDFGAVIRAQGVGDARALFDRGQWVLRVTVGNDAPASVQRLASWFAEKRRG